MENIIIRKKDLQEVVHSIKITFLFSTVIAAFICLLVPQAMFIEQFLTAQSIGLTMVSIFLLANILYPPLSQKFIRQYCFLPFPVLIATLIGMNFLRNYTSFLELYAMILIISLPALLVFHYRESKKSASISLKEEKQKRELSDKQLLASKLLLLQAQINPHFLFNTLANIDAYIDISPNKAKALLKNYTVFLRHSLKTTQSNEGNIKNEVDLINAYMSIQQIRFPNILFKQNIDKQLLDRPLSPLLIQPLIENALIHGLAPQGNQGEITLTIKLDNQQLLIQVSDNGVGLNSSNASNNGIALKNIKSRVQLYKEQARFMLAENSAGGVNATLSIPL